VFRDGKFVGAFDFDTCAPGSRVWDLAYSAYRFVPLMPPQDTEMDQSLERASSLRENMLARLSRFLRAYAGPDTHLLYRPEVLLENAGRRLEAIALWTEQHAKLSHNASLQEDAATYRRHARWLTRV
jgi:Ser/Thr protein kinase RdoA (MazF antagonist)